MKTPPSLAAKIAAGIAAILAGAMFAACGGSDRDASQVFMPNPTPGVDKPVVLANFKSTSLVADTATTGIPNTDAKLVNAWGVAFNPAGFVWVANNGSSTSTLYDGNGVPQTLVVTTPASPTGIVFNGSQDFKISNGTVTAASPFVFATERGVIAAWSPTVNRTATVTMFDGGSANKVYNLWGIAFGPGINSQPTNTLFFTAGPDDETHGLYGRIDMQ